MAPKSKEATTVDGKGLELTGEQDSASGQSIETYGGDLSEIRT